MNRFFTLVILLFSVFPVFGQEDVAVLSKELTASKTTDLEKVSSIFHWITDNIAYRVKPSPQKVIGNSSLRNYQSEMLADDDDSPLKPLNERVSETVLKKKAGLCEGYARLFTTLCDYAGIRSEVIVGYARSNNITPKNRFGVNHYWNAVMIDSQWHLLDATWASGYLSLSGDEFIRSYDGKYFLPDPSEFIQDHYPDDARWTLLPDPQLPNEFRRSPFKQKSFTKYHFTSFYPSNGIIETFVGDTLYLHLETAAKEQGREVCPDLLIDSTIFSHSATWVFLKPDPVVTLNKHQYTYPVSSPGIEWLYLMYNDDLVLRYKINVKKKRGD